jgi:two-component sensor histidine kinase/PAS domain-containing protein
MTNVDRAFSRRTGAPAGHSAGGVAGCPVRIPANDASCDFHVLLLQVVRNIGWRVRWFSRFTPVSDPSRKSFWAHTFRGSDETGAFFEAIVAAIQQPLLILKHDLTVEAANLAFYKGFRVDARQTIGHEIYSLGNGQWDIPELRRLLDRVLRKETIVRNYRVDHDFEGLGRRVMLLNAKRFDREGGEAWMVLTVFDNTEIELAKEYANNIVDAFRDPLLVLESDLRVRTANAPFYSMFQVEPGQTEGRLVYDLGSGQWDIPRLRELLEDILPKESVYNDFEVEYDFEEIGHRIMLLNARRVDSIQLILLVIEDVTDQRQSAAQQNARQKMLLGELQHRVKNLLTNVRALAQQTLQGASSLDAFADSFDGRLDAMARTQDLLVSGPEDTAQLAEIVRLELEALGAREASTFNLHGPKLELSERASHAMAMTVHELATNAAKYGALSQQAPEGRIDIAWSIDRTEGGTVRFQFNWRESGIVVSPRRSKSGFGTQIIEHSMPYLFGGSSTLSYHADGVECALKVPLPSEDVALATADRD